MRRVSIAESTATKRNTTKTQPLITAKKATVKKNIAKTISSTKEDSTKKELSMDDINDALFIETIKETSDDKTVSPKEKKRILKEIEQWKNL